MLCLWQEPEEAKPGLERGDQTPAKGSCWVPQEPRVAPPGPLLSCGVWTNYPPRSGEKHHQVSLMPIAKALITLTNHEGWLGELMSSNQDNGS